MIFKNFNENRESYKERNFYYKVFAGCLFNELLPQYKQNKAAFFKLLNDQIGKENCFVNDAQKEKLPGSLNQLATDELQVSFDFHTAQTKIGDADRGEMSDIVIWGKEYFISIEVKYLTDWTYDKDIKSVQDRMELINGENGNKNGIQVLLLKEEKWKNNLSKIKQKGSNLKCLQDEQKLSFPLIVITWEQISDIIKNHDVKEFISNQLKRKLNPKVSQNATA